MMAVKLKLDKTFQPCPAEPGDELYPNGIFEFNITRLLAFVETHVERFPIERVEVEGIPNYGSENLDEEAICARPASPKKTLRGDRWMTSCLARRS